MVSHIKRNQSAQKTVKAYDLDIALINQRAKQLGCTAAEVIHQMCEELRRQTYRKELDESFQIALSNPQSREEFRTEQALWDVTNADGLTDAT